MDDQDKFVSFRCPPKLARAMATAANREMISMSDIIRQAVIRELRQRGFMDERAA
jgi:predicted HicB family RNase H-like nuclease